MTQKVKKGNNQKYPILIMTLHYSMFESKLWKKDKLSLYKKLKEFKENKLEWIGKMVKGLKRFQTFIVNEKNTFKTCFFLWF